MEHYGCIPNDVSATVHNNMYNWNGGIPPTSYHHDTTAIDDFHVYEVEWTEDELRFYVDEVYIGTYFRTNSGWQQWPYDQEFYIILNLAIGSHFMSIILMFTITPSPITISDFKIPIILIYLWTIKFIAPY